MSKIFCSTLRSTYRVVIEGSIKETYNLRSTWSSMVWNGYILSFEWYMRWGKFFLNKKSWEIIKDTIEYRTLWKIGSEAHEEEISKCQIRGIKK